MIKRKGLLSTKEVPQVPCLQLTALLLQCPPSACPDSTAHLHPPTRLSEIALQSRIATFLWAHSLPCLSCFLVSHPSPAAPWESIPSKNQCGCPTLHSCWVLPPPIQPLFPLLLTPMIPSMLNQTSRPSVQPFHLLWEGSWSLGGQQGQLLSCATLDSVYCATAQPPLHCTSMSLLRLHASQLKGCAHHC